MPIVLLNLIIRFFKYIFYIFIFWALIGSILYLMFDEIVYKSQVKVLLNFTGENMLIILIINVIFIIIFITRSLQHCSNEINPINIFVLNYNWIWTLIFSFIFFSLSILLSFIIQIEFTIIYKCLSFNTIIIGSTIITILFWFIISLWYIIATSFISYGYSDLIWCEVLTVVSLSVFEDIIPAWHIHNAFFWDRLILIKLIILPIYYIYHNKYTRNNNSKGKVWTSYKWLNLDHDFLYFRSFTFPNNFKSSLVLLIISIITILPSLYFIIDFLSYDWILSNHKWFRGACQMCCKSWHFIRIDTRAEYFTSFDVNHTLISENFNLKGQFKNQYMSILPLCTNMRLKPVDNITVVEIEANYQLMDIPEI